MKNVLLTVMVLMGTNLHAAGSMYECDQEEKGVSAEVMFIGNEVFLKLQDQGVESSFQGESLDKFPWDFNTKLPSKYPWKFPTKLPPQNTTTEKFSGEGFTKLEFTTHEKIIQGRGRAGDMYIYFYTLEFSTEDKNYLFDCTYKF